MVFVLQFSHYRCYKLPQIPLNATILYGFSRSKPWKVGKSWIIHGLKLKWDALGGKTIHEGALVLIGFIWSLSVLTRLFLLWSDWLSSLAMFSENDEDFLESLPLNVCDQTLMHV